MIRALVALLLLNAALSFKNHWPTPLIVPDFRIAPEAIWLWVLLLVLAWRGRAVSATLASGLAAGYLGLVLARYWDVTVPALFGRPVHLWWDGRELPRLLALAIEAMPWWQPAALFAGVLVLLFATWWGLRAAIILLARDGAPRALRSRSALALTAIAVVMVLGNHAGVQATWPYVSKPVIPTYAAQLAMLHTALSPQRLAQELPPSPSFDGSPVVLAGADVKIVFVESYGRVAFDVPEIDSGLASSRARFAAAAHAQGLHIASAFVVAPTFGGGSGLSHLALLAGIDTSVPGRNDLLVTTARPTLVGWFAARGYRTIGVGMYPGNRPEIAFYGFEHLYRGEDLDYPGPRFGYWEVPDQFAMARLDERHPAGLQDRPRFVVFPTLASHAPFGPVPPCQPDWQALVGPDPWTGTAAHAIAAQPSSWSDQRERYVEAIAYTFEWLAKYVGLERPRPELLILVGDHQPPASVSGPHAGWEVPVHVVSADADLIAAFVASGFTRGIQPVLPAIASMHEMTPLLLDVLGGASHKRP